MSVSLFIFDLQPARRSNFLLEFHLIADLRPRNVIPFGSRTKEKKNDGSVSRRWRQQLQSVVVVVVAVEEGGRKRSGIRRDSASFRFLGGLCISVGIGKEEISS